MTVRIHYKGNHNSSDMEFPAGTPPWEAIQKSLASVDEKALSQITVLYIYKDPPGQPTVMVGPFD